MPVTSEEPETYTGCARRSPIEKLKDAGSIPATSTHRPPGRCAIVKDLVRVYFQASALL